MSQLTCIYNTIRNQKIPAVGKEYFNSVREHHVKGKIKSLDFSFLSDGYPLQNYFKRESF
jgi:hypothetical protein